MRSLEDMTTKYDLFIPISYNRKNPKVGLGKLYIFTFN